MRKCALFVLCLLLIVTAPAYVAYAVGTSYWTQTNETDFKGGTLENVVATNLGDLKLSRAVKTLLDQDPQISSVNTLAEGPDGSIYAGTGPHAVLLRIKEDKVSTVATLPDAAAILSLKVDKTGTVLLGTGGESGHVLKIDKPGDKPHVIFEAEGVQYVWGLAQTSDGNVYAATGPAGQLFEIKPDGSKRVLLATAEANLLSLVSDGKDLLYLGTDPHGLIYRVNRKTGESFVLYNAVESEISALALDKNGNLYAGTSEAKEEPPPAPEPAAPDKGGRPEGGALGVPIPADRPKEPTPPAPPNPNPGQPDPIPNRLQSRAHERALMQRRAIASTTCRAGTARQLTFAAGSARPTPPSAHPATQNRTIESPAPSPLYSGEKVGVRGETVTIAQLPLTLPSPLSTGEREPSDAGFQNGNLAGCTPCRELTGYFGVPQDDAFLCRWPAIAHDFFAGVWSNDGRAPVVFAFASEARSDNPPDDSGKKKHPKPGPGPAPDPNPGKPQPAPGPQTAPATALPTKPPVDTTVGTEPRPEGNAIYKIDPDGFVTEVFRQPVLILSMIENNGTLLVATGGIEGQVYQVRPSADETLVLARVDAKEIMCLLAAHDGKIYMGTANVGTLASMSGGYATKGTFESPILDATQISRFGKIHLHGRLPGGTSLMVETRSGNVKEADEKTWSKWSDSSPAAEFMQVMSPSARFLQYRLTFASTEGQATPVVHDVSIAYQVPNLPPQIKAVKIANAGAGADAATDLDAAVAPHRIESSRHQTIAWEASDPNNDILTYSLYLRPLGEKGWILLKDKLTDQIFDWDTRTTADGRYEVKVVASDAVSNPPSAGKTASRVSDPITVDNTPPVIGDIKSQQHGADIKIDMKVVDRTSTVAAVDYSVDSNKDWQFVLPTDQIYDSPEEAVSITIPNLRPGQHQIALRATDSKGNQSFENLFINVQGPAARNVER